MLRCVPLVAAVALLLSAQLGVAAGPTSTSPLIKDLAQSSSSLGRPPEYGVRRLAAAFQNAYGK